MTTDNEYLSNRTPLFETQSGSRLYGTNLPTSDVDIKEIYLPALGFLVSGKKIKIVSQSTKVANTADDVDREYIPIQIFARDFIGGQTYAIELAFAALCKTPHAQQVIFGEHDAKFLMFVEELTRVFLTSNIKAMVGYAMNQSALYGIRGNRAASIRKIRDEVVRLRALELASTDDRLSMLDSWIAENGDKYVFKSSVLNNEEEHDTICALGKQYFYSITLTEALGLFDAALLKYGARVSQAELNKGVDWKAQGHAVRITKQAIQLLNDHSLSLPIATDDVTLLLDIRNGKKTMEEFKGILEQHLDALDAAKDTTTLRPSSPELMIEFEQWLTGWMLEFYKN